MHELKRRLLRDPLAVSRELARTEDGQATRTRIRDLGLELNVLVDERNVLTVANKRRSRAIGAARKRGDDCSELLAGMRGDSAKIKRIAGSISRVVDELTGLAGAEAASPSMASADGMPRGAISQVITQGAPSRFEPQIGPDGPGVTASRICDRVDDAAWDAYVDSHPHSSAYHSSSWRALIKRNFGHDGHYLNARDDSGRIVGVLPLVHLKSRLFGSFLVSMPYLNYGGPIADSEAISRQLMDHCGNIADELGCSHAEIRECRPRRNWTARTHKVAMIRALPETAEELDRQLGSRVRAQVKRSLDASPAITFGGEELLRAFYSVFSRNMRDLGTPVYGIDFFRDMLFTFPHAFLAVVTIDSRPVAAAFLLGHRDTLEIPWASSLRSVNPLGANMFMYRSILAEAQDRGYRYFDFGRSTKDGATFRFKKQWGAKPRQLHWHYWTADGAETPKLDPDNPKYRFAIKCWQHLPVRLSVLLGPGIVRNLP